MRKLTDEEIQKIVEDSLLQRNTAAFLEEDEGQVKIYSLLFEELKSQPVNSLPDDFADRVINKINTKKALADTLKYYGLILFLVLLFLVVTIGTFAYAEVPYLNSILIIGNRFKGAIIFGIICLLLIQFFDQLLVKNRIAGKNF